MERNNRVAPEPAAQDEEPSSLPGSATQKDAVAEFEKDPHASSLRTNGGAHRRPSGNLDETESTFQAKVSRSSSVVWFNDETDERPTILVPGVFFILHPYSSPRLSWDMYVIGLLVYTVFQVPASLAFQSQICAGQPSTFDLILSFTVDISFWIDIVLTFRTAVVDTHTDTLTQLKLIMDWKRIAKMYLKGWFWLDVMGSIPMALVEAIIFAANGDAAGAQQEACSYSALKTFKLNRLARLARLVKLLRLARLARWNRLVTKAKDALSMNPGHVRLLQWVIFVLVLAHLFACVLYGIVSLEVEYERTWATGVTTVVPGVGPVVLQCPLPLTDPETFEITPDSPTRIGEDHNGVQVLQCMQPDGTWLNEASAFVKYLMSLYVTFTTLTTVGYGDVTMRTSPELFLAIIMMAGGASTFAVVVGNMAALLSKLDVRARVFKERMEDLDDFMHQENLPLDLRFRTRSFFEYGFNHSREIPASIDELSSSLRTEVALHLYNDLITTVPFFKDCGKEFLTEVILRIKSQTLSPADFLYEEGETGDSMFFLIKGCVEVVLDEHNGIYAELKEGSYFGENCILGLSSVRPMSVRAINWCSLFCLTQDALEDCLVHHPDAHSHFRKLVVAQTAEKTIATAVRRMKLERLQEQRPDDPQIRTWQGESEREERQRQRGVEPPVVTRALARSRLQQRLCNDNNPLVAQTGAGSAGANPNSTALGNVHEDGRDGEQSKLSAAMQLNLSKARDRRELIKRELDALEAKMLEILK